MLASRPSFQGRHIPGGGNPSDRWGVRGLILDLGLCTCFSVWHLNPPPGLSSPVHGDQGSLLASFPRQALLELKPALSQEGLWPTCPVAMVPAVQWTATATVTKFPWLVSQA